MNKPDLQLIVDNAPVEPPKLKVRAVNLVYFKSLDLEAPPEKWIPVKPDEVPHWAKDNEAINQLIAGNLVINDVVDEHYYRAEAIGVAH